MAAGEVCIITANADGTVTRDVRYPGASVADLSSDLQAQVNAVWTTGYIAAWLAATYPIPTLAELKQAAVDRVTAQKVSALQSMTYLGYTITLGTQDQIDVLVKIQQLTATGGTTRWEVVNGVFVTWGLADVQALFSAGQAYVAAVYANADTLVAAISAAIDAEGVAAIDPAAGWPS